MRLDFLKFLREYHCIDPDAADIASVTGALAYLGGAASYKTLLDALSRDDETRLQLIPVIWHLVAVRRLIVDLDQPVTDEVLISLPSDRRKA